MKKSGSYLSATALGSVTAVAALLIGLSGANAQAPQPAPPLTGAGSFPGSFIVPGTNTSLHVGGVVELDTWYDTSNFGNADSPGADAHLDAQSVGTSSAVAAHGDHGTWYWTAQFSRFNFETRTPTPYGELKTYIEVDFDGSASDGTTSYPVGGTTINAYNQGYLARVKQAYGTLGPWLFGQSASLFADLDAWADTLDAPAEAGAFMGVTDYRIPQIRYTYLLPGGLSLAGSIEDFQSGGIIDTTAGAGAYAVTALDTAAVSGNYNDFFAFSERWPALVGNLRDDQPWGHAEFHVAVADEQFKNLGAAVLSLPVNSREDQWGFQSALSGHLNTFGQDKLTWSLGYGVGAAQYSEPLNGGQLGANYMEGLVCAVGAASISCSQARVMGVNAGYSHHWTPDWRSTIAVGYDHSSLPSAASVWLPGSSGLGELSHNTESGAINLLWRPLPAVQFGIENDFYHHSVWSGGHGSDDRIHFQALFSF